MAQWAQVFNDTVLITVFVFITMLIVDYINVVTAGRFSTLMRGGRWRQYTVSSILGTTPGCVGAFMDVSFYTHGLLSFGALVGGMAAVSGDEAFVMLVQFPKKAVLLFSILAIVGTVWGMAVDRIIKLLKILPSRSCDLQQIHTLDTCQCIRSDDEKPILKRSLLGVSFTRAVLLLATGTVLVLLAAGLIGTDRWDWEKITLVVLITIANMIIGSASDHYLREHVWSHLVRKHLWRVFLWTLGAMLLVDIGLKAWDIETLVRSHVGWILFLSAFIGLIPQSGPHLVFVVLFSKGLVPFSVLFTSSIVQDGHGMLPLLGYSVRDAVMVKAFNLVLGLSTGTILFLLGY